MSDSTDGSSNPAKAENAKGLSVKFIANVFITSLPSSFPKGDVSLLQHLRKDEGQAEEMFRHRDIIGIRRIDHPYPLLRGCLQIDVLHPDPMSPNHFEFRGRLHHLPGHFSVRPNDDPIDLLHLFDQGILFKGTGEKNFCLLLQKSLSSFVHVLVEQDLEVFHIDPSLPPAFSKAILSIVTNNYF